VGLFFPFGNLFDLVGRVAQDAINNAAPGIFTGRIPLVSEPNHFIGQFQGPLDIFITSPQEQRFSKKGLSKKMEEPPAGSNFRDGS
jgi:hypothetical protein